ncbi:UNVERIFIED_CONTAM: hypothetical protein RMT77_016030 [Armadillidium vulgare]
MNRLPSPFASNMPTILTPQNSSSGSPGFLMMTRPPSASSDHSGRIKNIGRGRSRGNHWSNHSPQEYRGAYSNNNSSGFTPPVRHQGNYFNRTPYRRNHNSHHNFRTPSPNTNFINYRNTPSDHSNLQSTPNSSGKKFFKHEKFQNHKNTPLKSIPIEKFVSANMVKEPWGNLQIESLSQQNSMEEDCLDEEVGSLSEPQSGTESPSSINSDVDSDKE